MKYNPDQHHRRSIRYKGHDYTTPGAYFVTICTYQRQCLFGAIIHHAMHLKILWIGDRHHSNLHEKGTVSLTTCDRQFGKPVPGSIPTIVGSFKSAATRHINNFRNAPGTPLWQRNYYEHIILNEESLQSIRQYIKANPSKWKEDQWHPNRSKQ